MVPVRFSTRTSIGRYIITLGGTEALEAGGAVEAKQSVAHARGGELEQHEHQSFALYQSSLLTAGLLGWATVAISCERSGEDYSFRGEEWSWPEHTHNGRQLPLVVDAGVMPSLAVVLSPEKACDQKARKARHDESNHDSPLDLGQQ